VNTPSEKSEKRSAQSTWFGWRDSSSRIKERRYAAELGVYFASVTLLLAGFLTLWFKAINDGGFWWIVAAVVLVLGVIVGERLKKRVETLIRLSREARGEKKKD